MCFMSLLHNIAPIQQASVKTILVVEDDHDTAEVIHLVLVDETHYSILAVATASEALRVASTTQVDLFIIDYLLTETDGNTLYDQLRALPGLADVVLATEHIRSKKSGNDGSTSTFSFQSRHQRGGLRFPA